MTHTNTRVLGIDYGKARIGLAVSDTSKTLASHFLLLHNKDIEKTLAKLISIVKEQSIDTIIIGLPLGTDGTKTQMSVIIEKFILQLDTLLTWNRLTVSLIPWNETVTSYEAYENLLQKGLTHQKAKQLVDIESARIILQEYLDNKEQL